MHVEGMEQTWDGLPINEEPPYGAAVVVFRQTGTGYQYLILHRTHAGPDFAGDWAWGAPAGCRLPGESFEACARRELLEETGLELPLAPTALGNGDWHVYRAEAPAGARVRLSAEHDQHQWLPAHAAASKCLPQVVADQIRGVAALLGDW